MESNIWYYTQITKTKHNNIKISTIFQQQKKLLNGSRFHNQHPNEEIKMIDRFYKIINILWMIFCVHLKYPSKCNNYERNNGFNRHTVLFLFDPLQ